LVFLMWCRNSAMCFHKRCSEFCHHCEVYITKLTFYEEHYSPIEPNTAPTRVNEGNSKTSTSACR
jgi:hypothetical protein